jgi:hypothetical protein
MHFGRAEERCYSKTNSLVPDRREKIEIAMNSEGEKSKKENGLPIAPGNLEKN